MSNGQKTLLGCSIISYLLVLYSFFRFNLWLILVFSIIHSLVLLALAFLFWKTNEDDNELIELQAKYQQAAMKSEQEVETLTGKLNEQMKLTTAKEAELAAANERIQSLNADIEELREALSNAVASAAMAAETVEAASEYEALLPPIDPNESENETIDILTIAKSTIEELTPFADAAGMKMVLSAPEKTMLVKANQGRLRILFRNIIDNSIKYMNRSGSLLITISSIGDDIFIVLKDNGNGLSEKETKHIFELNYQGSNRISGNGLGLTQAKAIVDYYGGSIYAKSMIGRGMGIYIQLPTT
ncbi:MAG: HAMP domain-containing histidine kinase [Eubacterium sp.]|nr:HAMP domain-containing histidine kinase [Eubacterium sp.]